jgi:hypothetical protein
VTDPATPTDARAAPGRPAFLGWRRAGPWLATAAVLGLAVGLLRYEGRVWWCACGVPAPWVGDTRGPHNSQHLFDPYSFTHVLHGVVLCGLLAWGLPRLPPAWKLWLAVTLEASWEVFENSQFVIDRYRTATASLGYQGDSVANSLGDIVSCAAGFLLARRLGWRWSLALCAAVEVLLLVWIRDSLLLNVVMLLHPFEAVKAWQAGG